MCQSLTIKKFYQTHRNTKLAWASTTEELQKWDVFILDFVTVVLSKSNQTHIYSFFLHIYNEFLRKHVTLQEMQFITKLHTLVHFTLIKPISKGPDCF